MLLAHVIMVPIAFIYGYAHVFDLEFCAAYAPRTSRRWIGFLVYVLPV
jgi:hypothetical protein